MSARRVALLTAGGFVPYLSSAVGDLIERYNEIDPEIEIIAYQNDYHGLLTGNLIVADEEVCIRTIVLHYFEGPPIDSSRIKLTNTRNLVERGLVVEGENPLERVAEQLHKDGVDILHIIGGDDTNTAAAGLTVYLKEHDYHLTAAGLLKTIDNDAVSIRQSLGAWTTAEEVSEYVQNVIGEHHLNSRMLIIHEIMGRNCRWLTTAGPREYHEWLKTQEWVPSIGLSKERWDIHAVFLLEVALNVEAEAARLKEIMSEQGSVNIFLSEGTSVLEIITEMEATGIEVQHNPSGHVKLDTINPGQWFIKQFASKIETGKVMIQKSGYFSRSSHASTDGLRLIGSMVDLATGCALRSEPGVIGHGEENGDRLRVISFLRIAGGEPFDTTQKWFAEMTAGTSRDVKPTVK